MNTRARQSAFSLVEVMLAVSLLGVLTVTVTMMWSQGLNGWKRSSRMMEVFQRERVVLGTLAELTQSIVFYRVRDGLYDIVASQDAAGAQSISFVTSSEELLPPTMANIGGLRRVTIALVQDQYGRPYLGIRNQPALSTGEQDPNAPFDVFSAEVSGFTVKYRHPRTNSWEDKWEEKNMAPAAIEYRITFGGEDPRVTAVTAVRQVDLPSAAYSLATGGASPGEQSRATGRRRDISSGRGPVPASPPSGGGAD